MEQYNNLTPFQEFFCSNFPFIEENFDSLTTYKMLCKIVGYLQDTIIPAVDKIGNSQNEVIEKFLELKSYVDNYFVNLDVQEEINKKLDDMVLSGELQELVNNKITELTNMLEEEISNQNEKINSLTSGSPAGVYDTLEKLKEADPDHSKIYLVLSDNYWYYFNNNTSEWNQGGQYLTANFNIPNNSIAPYQILNNVVTSEKILERYTVGDGFINTDGSIIESSIWKYTILFPVSEGTNIVVSNACGYYIQTWDKFKNFVQAYQTGSFEEASEQIFKVPSGISYVTFNIRNNFFEIFDAKIESISMFNSYALRWLKVYPNNIDPSLSDNINLINNYYKNKIVMYGDSIVKGVTDSGNYLTRLKTNLSLETIANEGVAGAPMTNGSGQGMGTVGTISNTINKYIDFNTIIIAVGTNDFKLNMELGEILEIGNETLSPYNFTGAYQISIERILQANPKLNLILMTPIQRNNSGYDIYKVNDVGYKLIDYVNRIKEIGSLYSIPVIDMYSNSGVNMITLNTYTDDGLHPNSDGYDLLTNYLTRQMLSI